KAVVAWADLADPNLGPVLDRYQSHPKFRGVLMPVDQDLPEGLAELERRQLTLDLPDATSIPRIASRFPSLRMIIDHLGRPPADPDAWRRAIEQAAQYPQVFGKLS